jgi:hypothetical protein
MKFILAKMGIHFTQVTTIGCGLAYKGFIMENDKLEALARNLDETTNAINYASFRIEAIRKALAVIVPGFEKEYEKAMDQVRCLDDLAQIQSGSSPSKGHRVADLIAGLLSPLE